MKDFIKDQLSIYQKFSMALSDTFRRIRYGLAPCKEGCCEELQGVRYELLQWQLLKDEYTFSNSLTAGPDHTITLPNNSVVLNAVYISLTPPSSILWTQLSGNTVTISDPTSLNTTIIGITVGDYEFQIRVTDPSGSVLMDSTVIHAISSEVSIDWGYSAANPLSTISTFVPQFTQAIAINASVYTDLDFTNAANEKYLVLREPATSPLKSTWTNTAFNYGTFPDQVFLVPLVVGAYRYYISRNPVFLGVGTTKITFQ